MSLLQEFRDRHKVKPTEPAKQILFAVMGDLLGRSGFDGTWDGIDDEDKEDLLTENLEIVKRNLP